MILWLMQQLKEMLPGTTLESIFLGLFHFPPKFFWDCSVKSNSRRRDSLFLICATSRDYSRILTLKIGNGTSRYLNLDFTDQKRLVGEGA